MENINITQEVSSKREIDANGNIKSDFVDFKYSLVTDANEEISDLYYGIISLGNDNYAVCDLVSETNLSNGYTEYDILSGNYEVTSCKMKWGIIHLQRDDYGAIIPGGELLLVPYLYDAISSNNMDSATVKYNNKLTYIDLSRKKGNLWVSISSLYFRTCCSF